MIVKIRGTCKHWSKVNWGDVYENLTPAEDTIAFFKKKDEEKFFLEDPMKLLDPENNELARHHKELTGEIDFSAATWKQVFEYSMMGNLFDPFKRAELMPEKSKRFLKALAENAAKHCPDPLQIPLCLAVGANDIDTTRILLQREDSFVTTEPLILAIIRENLEMLKILLEHGASTDELIQAKQHCMMLRFLDGITNYEKLLDEALEKKQSEQENNKN